MRQLLAGAGNEDSQFWSSENDFWKGVLHRVAISHLLLQMTSHRSVSNLIMRSLPDRKSLQQLFPKSHLKFVSFLTFATVHFPETEKLNCKNNCLRPDWRKGEQKNSFYTRHKTRSSQSQMIFLTSRHAIRIICDYSRKTHSWKHVPKIQKSS